MTRARAIRRRLASQSGFSLIELLVAILLTTVGVMAIVSTFDYSRKLVTTAEKNEVIAHKAEAEMEKVLAIQYDKIALTAAPSASTNPDNPDYYLSGTSYRWDQGTTGPQSDQLVIDSANGAVTHVSNWDDQVVRLSGSVYRYVTQVPGSSGNAKRVTIVVTVNGRDLKKGVMVSSIVTNPDAGTGY
jgi:prepilin-type N-terminal cleavage/methylation domain-containing protein